MKRWTGIVIIVSAVMLLVSGDVWAVNRVVVETKDSVGASAKHVQVGVFITNDIPIQGAVIPLEFRTISGSGYIKDSFVFAIPPANRLGSSPLGASYSPMANVTNYKYATIGFDTSFSATCGKNGSTIDSTHTFKTKAAQVDFVSPDAILHATVSTGDPGVGDSIYLQPGTDPAGTANASILFTFNVNAGPGVFAIDTCCITPANRLGFVDPSTSLVKPGFTRGLVGVNQRAPSGVTTLETGQLPTAYTLEQNYPNPFNASTVIRFMTPHDGFVKLDIYNVLGQKVRTLANEFRPMGLQVVEWDGADDHGQTVASGVYFYRLQTTDFVNTRKMLLLK